MTKRERKRLAEALLDPSSTAQYLLSRLGDEWEAVTPAVLIKLGKRYGAEVVTDALRGIRVMDAHPSSPVPYLEGACVRIVAEAS